MVTIDTRTHVGPDGVLRLRMPEELRDADVQVHATIQATPATAVRPSPDELGWSPGFFESTAGKWQGSLVRESQGEFEVREELD